MNVITEATRKLKNYWNEPREKQEELLKLVKWFEITENEDEDERAEYCPDCDTKLIRFMGDWRCQACNYTFIHCRECGDLFNPKLSNDKKRCDDCYDMDDED